MRKVGALIFLLGTAGLRYGEAVTLTIADIYFQRGRINVNKNAVTVNGVVKLGTLKSGKPRTVAVSAAALKLLSARTCNKQNDEFLWTDKKVNLYEPSNQTHFSIELFSESKPLTLTFPHSLRHVAAGFMVSSGANVKVVQRQLGHASAAMTLDTYADLFDDDLDGISSRINKLFPNLNMSNLRQIS